MAESQSHSAHSDCAPGDAGLHDGAVDPDSVPGAKPRSFKAVLTAVILMWFAGICYGAVKLLNYNFTPAPPPHASAVWPPDSSLVAQPSKFTLVMVAHPQCPCTEATLSELEIIMARFHDRLRAEVLFIQPEGMTEDWVKSKLWKHAATIPGADA